MKRFIKTFESYKISRDKLVLYRSYSHVEDKGIYYTPDFEYVIGFGGNNGKYKTVHVDENAKIFDINNESNFNELLESVGEIYFEVDGSVFKSFDDFLNHNGRVIPDIIAEANNSWIVEKYKNNIKEFGYDLIKFMDGGYESYIILNFDKVKPV